MGDLLHAVLTDPEARTQTAATKVAANASDSFTPWQSAE